MRFGYARVSTLDQNLDLQIDALKKEQCNEIFIDKISGTKSDKINLNLLLLKIRKGDELVVWRLDRLGRTTVSLINLLTEFKRNRYVFKSLNESINTSTPTGQLLTQLLCILAEHERSVLIERTQAGLSSARARGKVGGIPAGLTSKYASI